MLNIGPFVVGELGRIVLEFSQNNAPVEVNNPRVQQIFGPDGEEISGYPKLMTEIKSAVYYMEDIFEVAGNYTAIIQAEYNLIIIEKVVEFVVQTRSLGYPRIEVACDE